MALMGDQATFSDGTGLWYWRVTGGFALASVANGLNTATDCDEPSYRSPACARSASLNFHSTSPKPPYVASVEVYESCAMVLSARKNCVPAPGPMRSEVSTSSARPVGVGRRQLEEAEPTAIEAARLVLPEATRLETKRAPRERRRHRAAGGVFGEAEEEALRRVRLQTQVELSRVGRHEVARVTNVGLGAVDVPVVALPLELDVRERVEAVKPFELREEELTLGELQAVVHLVLHRRQRLGTARGGRLVLGVVRLLPTGQRT